ncbi:MAG: LysR family transcriptional regulator [Burkholderiaceae bacterium]
MRRKIPSSLTLSIFEAAVRHSSFTVAAHDLSLTQSAVCKQIAALESYLGLALFRRSGRGVVPTPAALDFSQRVGAALDMLERDTADLIARGGSSAEVTIAALPTFASRWLIPQLPSFYAAHPQITINLVARTRPFLFEQTTIDAAIFARDAGWPGTEQTFLMDEDPVAVCAPSLIHPRRRIVAADFQRHRLLHLDTRPQAWRQWFESCGLKIGQDRLGPRLETFALIADSAVHGLGFALVPRILVQEQLARGQLIEARLARRASAAGASTAYYLICPEKRGPNPALDAFRDWLVVQCQRHSASGRAGEAGPVGLSSTLRPPGRKRTRQPPPTAPSAPQAAAPPADTAGARRRR